MLLNAIKSNTIFDIVNQITWHLTIFLMIINEPLELVHVYEEVYFWYKYNNNKIKKKRQTILILTNLTEIEGQKNV